MKIAHKQLMAHTLTAITFRDFSYYTIGDVKSAGFSSPLVVSKELPETSYKFTVTLRLPC